ncbi:MAG: glycine cleavage system protein GcvH [Actinobacteria bacterium]|nr:glycine cleavage system protein GcvH [Actinomycetota bacterium]
MRTPAGEWRSTPTASVPWSSKGHGSGIVPPVDVPEDLRYSPDHEWVRVEAGQVRMGITDYAQDALGDIVFVQVPSVGTAVTVGSSLSEVESTKSVSEVYAPVTGTVVEVNDDLGDTPERLNEDPYGSGWICVIDPADPKELDRLLDAQGYRGLIDG